jgi:NAD(P)-dependent dehydrogenase (short-subunit alcohol dehydrogenase family)
LTRSIAFHYGDQGIRCNAVCPGAVATGIGIGGKTPHEAGMTKVFASMQGTPAQTSKPGQPEEIAAAIAFLASDEASYLNGAIVPVDNGWLAG